MKKENHNNNQEQVLDKKTVYKVPVFSKFFTLFMAIFALFFSIYFIFTQINTDTATVKKVLPFLILLFAFDALYRNLFALYRVTFKNDSINFSYLAKKNVKIDYKSITKLETVLEKKKFFRLHYAVADELRTHNFPMAYKNIIDILKNIRHYAPQTEVDEFINSVAPYS